MLKNMRVALFTLIALVSFTTVNAMTHAYQKSHDKQQLSITDPWIRSAPINAPALGLFMQITNNSDRDLRLTSAHVEGYQRVELHRTIDSNGMMKMVRQEFMPIPAHSKLHLKPGSWHIMLIKPDRVPSEGERVMVSLRFNDGSAQVIRASVRKGRMMIKHHSMD
jgi:periplasmic copper chaperone A